jgi:hypothetical protein
VRHYTTKRVGAYIVFTCAYCQHSVNTRDFDLTGGNLRTQAATAANQHVAAAHNKAGSPLKPGFGLSGDVHMSQT